MIYNNSNDYYYYKRGKLMKQLKRTIYLILGIVCVIAAIIGVFLPILPTTPFFLLAFALFSVEPRVQNKLKQNKYFREYILIYRMGEPIPRKKVIMTLVFLWGMLCSSMYFMNRTWSYFLLSFIGLAVSVHILYVARGRKINEKNK